MRDTLPSTRPYWLTRRKCWTVLSIRGNGWAGRVKAERAWSPVSRCTRAVAKCCHRPSVTNCSKGTPLRYAKNLARLLRRCHENLHPSTPRFVAMLKAARATERCIKIAKGLSCATCREFTPQKSQNASKALKDLQFNDMVAVDTFEVDLRRRKVKFLNIVDLATGYQVCVPLWRGLR